MTSNKRQLPHCPSKISEAVRTYFVAQSLQSVLDDCQSSCNWGMWSDNAIKIDKAERELGARLDIQGSPPRDRQDARIREPRLAGEEGLHAVSQRGNRRSNQPSDGWDDNLTR